MKLREWWWSLIATLTINGYLPAHFTLAETALIVIMMWFTILMLIYWVEERLEKWGLR